MKIRKKLTVEEIFKLEATSRRIFIRHEDNL